MIKKKIDAIYSGWENEHGYMFWCTKDNSGKIITAVNNVGKKTHEMSFEIFKKWCKKYNYKID